MDLKTCPKCGKKYPDKFRFCEACGSELKEKTRVLSRGRWGQLSRFRIRTVWESLLVLGGLGMLTYSFLLTYGLEGIAPVMENLGGLIIFIILGAALTSIGLSGACNEVKVIGGNALTASGLGILILSFLTTHELMEQNPQLSNLVWLVIMIAAGAFLTVKGVPILRDLNINIRKTWGSALFGVGLTVLIFSILTIQNQVGGIPQMTNVTWPVIMTFLGSFFVKEGFSLLREPKDWVRMIWEGISLVVGISTSILVLFNASNLINKTLQIANLVWIIMLLVICVVSLAKGIKLIRE